MWVYPSIPSYEDACKFKVRLLEELDLIAYISVGELEVKLQSEEQYARVVELAKEFRGKVAKRSWKPQTKDEFDFMYKS